MSAQIAAPQRLTNQKIESQRNKSSRFIVGARCWFSRETQCNSGGAEGVIWAPAPGLVIACQWFGFERQV